MTEVCIGYERGCNCWECALREEEEWQRTMDLEDEDYFLSIEEDEDYWAGLDDDGSL